LSAPAAHSPRPPHLNNGFWSHRWIGHRCFPFLWSKGWALSSERKAPASSCGVLAGPLPRLEPATKRILSFVLSRLSTPSQPTAAVPRGQPGIGCQPVLTHVRIENALFRKFHPKSRTLRRGCRRARSSDERVSNTLAIGHQTAPRDIALRPASGCAQQTQGQR
jgi:hypothetical protein